MLKMFAALAFRNSFWIPTSSCSLSGFLPVFHWNPDEKEASAFDCNSLQLGRKGVWTFSLWRDKLNKSTDEASSKCVERDKELQASRMLSFNSQALSVPFLIFAIYIHWATATAATNKGKNILAYLNRNQDCLWNAKLAECKARQGSTRRVGNCDKSWDGPCWSCRVTARHCATLQHLSPYLGQDWVYHRRPWRHGWLHTHS